MQGSPPSLWLLVAAVAGATVRALATLTAVTTVSAATAVTGAARGAVWCLHDFENLHGSLLSLRSFDVRSLTALQDS